jgi:hypothetical protein
MPSRFSILASVVAAFSFLIGLLAPGPDEAEAVSLSFYVAPPTLSDGNSPRTTKDHLDHGYETGRPVDWDDTCTGNNVGCSVYARGWGYYPSGGPTGQNLASTQAVYFPVGTCQTVWWHLKDKYTSFVVGHVKELHTNSPRSSIINWYFNNYNVAGIGKGYFNAGRVIALTAADNNTTCSWQGSHAHEENDGGSNGGFWTSNEQYHNNDPASCPPTNCPTYQNNSWANYTRFLTW